MPHNKKKKTDSMTIAFESDSSAHDSEDDDKRRSGSDDEDNSGSGSDSGSGSGSGSEDSGTESDGESYAKNRKGEHGPGHRHQKPDLPKTKRGTETRPKAESHGAADSKLVPTTSGSFASKTSYAKSKFNLIDFDKKPESQSSAPKPTASVAAPAPAPTSSSSSAPKPPAVMPTAATAPQTKESHGGSSNSSSSSGNSAGHWIRKLEESNPKDDEEIGMRESFLELLKTKQLCFSNVHVAIRGNYHSWQAGGARYNVPKEEIPTVFMPMQSEHTKLRMYSGTVDPSRAFISKITFRDIVNPTDHAMAVYVEGYDFFNKEITPQGMKRKCMFVVPIKGLRGPTVAYNFSNDMGEGFLMYATNDQTTIVNEQVIRPSGTKNRETMLVLIPSDGQMRLGKKKNKLWLYNYIMANSTDFGLRSNEEYPTKVALNKMTGEEGKYVYFPQDTVIRALAALKNHKLNKIQHVDVRNFAIGIYPANQTAFTELCGTEYDVSGPVSKSEASYITTHRNETVQLKEMCLSKPRTFSFTISVECMFLRDIEQPAVMKREKKKPMAREEFDRRLIDEEERYRSSSSMADKRSASLPEVATTSLSASHNTTGQNTPVAPVATPSTVTKP